MTSIIFNTLSSKNIDMAHAFLDQMAIGCKTLCVRPREAMRQAAAQPNRGIVATYRDTGAVCGLTCLYDTIQPDYIESGSTCVMPDRARTGLGATILHMAIQQFYTIDTHAQLKIIGDVFDGNTAALDMVASIGFQIIDTPEWYALGRTMKGTPDQLSHPYHCVFVDRLTLSTNGYAPGHKAA